ncbi:MAG TPA: DUF899 domain-containing protein [Pseudonocardiaceae bacterium]|nr:DUF899 domain-containing protein [Pseudonocardiaceae bacterium]
MSLPEITSREEWLVARRELLAKEKAHTRQRDALNSERRRLPMVAVDQDYVFEGPDGPVRLFDMFDGHRQLILQHVMFGPSWDAACPGCTASLDEMSPALFAHLRSRDTQFVAVSRAPLAKLRDYAKSHGWEFAWYSSFGNDFNHDYQATATPAEYNYSAGQAEPGAEPDELPGVSCFLRDGDRVFHTYSTYARGTDQLGSAYSLLDLTAFGRSEDWEEPKGRAARLHGADPTFAD